MACLSFDELLRRADEEIFQNILGPTAIRLINMLDNKKASPTQLRELVRQLNTPAELLLDTDIRPQLLSLLRVDEARELVKLLELTGPNPYQTLSSLRLVKGSKREWILLNYFGLEVVELEATPLPESMIDCVPNYGLFPHQREAVKNVQQKLAKYPNRALLHMPTGSGKTRTAMHIIANHLLQTEPALVIWLAYSEELCEQAAEEFEICWQALGNRPVKLWRFWGSHESPSIDEVKDGVVIAGLAKMYKLLQRSTRIISTLGSRASLVVMDEAHQSIADTYATVLTVLTQTGSQAYLLGLTATPGRTWDDISEDEKLAAFYGGQKVSLDIEGYSNPVDYLIDNGYLAQVQYSNLMHNGGLGLSGADLQRIKASLDIPEDILQRLGEDDQRNLTILLDIKRLCESHNRIIVFASSVNHSDVLACVLQSQGLWAYSLTSASSSMERKRIITEFKASQEEPRILCNYGILTTGFDAPQTSAVLIARPTKSLVLYSQMIGRAIRGPKAGGNAMAEVVTVIDRELPGFGDLAESFMNWEDVWNEQDE